MKAKEQAKNRPVEQTGVLRERAMLVRFATKRWYGRGADKEVVAEVKEQHSASGDIGNFTKRFMSSEHLAPINAIVSEARKYHKAHTLAWGDTGARLLPADLFFDYKKEMTAYRMRFDSAVAEFVARYPALVEQERKRLNGLFKDRDYPSQEALKDHFRFATEVDPLPDAEDFRVDLGEEDRKRIKEEIKQRFEQDVTQTTGEIWERLQDMVGKLKERLSDSDAQIRGSLFDNLKDLVVLLPKLNVTGDASLAAMSKRVSDELLSGIDVEEIKDSAKKRTAVASKADAILESMKGFIK